MKSFITKLWIVSLGFLLCGSSYYHTKAMSDINAMAQALDLYKKDAGEYPETLDGLIHEGPDQGYLKYVPDDPWDNRYKYAFPANNGNLEYELYSFGKNGLDDSGLNDDISNWRGIDRKHYPVRIEWALLLISGGIFLLVLVTLVLVFIKLKNKYFKR